MRVVKKTSLFAVIFICLCAFKCISSDLEAVNLNEKIIYYYDNGTNAYIQSMNADGSEAKVIATAPLGISTGICTSRDRKKIYFVSATGARTVYSVNPDGSNLTAVKNLIGVVGAASCLSLSPDGKKLIVSSNSPGGDPAVIINSDGSGGITEVFSTFHSNVIYSPLGDKIAYVRYTTTNNVCISDVDGTNEKVLATNIASLRGLSWHPDGSKILYGNLGDNTLMEVRVDGSGSRCVYSGESFRSGVYSPDGYKIVANVANSLYILNIDGSNLKMLIFSGLNVTRPCFLGYSH